MANRQARRRLKAIDLFCGCGGLTLGLKRAGFDVIGAVDIDKISVDTYRLNHPEVKTWLSDIQALSPAVFMDSLGIQAGMLDLLAGCPPCQGFSRIRTLNGAKVIDDPRNELIFEFERFAKGLRPRAVMMENVPGMVKDRTFKEFLKNMADMGYAGSYKVLDAADYGVPQRRRRLIYLAGLGKEVPFSPPSKLKKTVRQAIAHLPKAGESGDPIHDMPECRSKRIMKLIRRIPKDGGSRTDLPKACQLRCHKEFSGFHDVYGRMAWDCTAPTITSGCFNPSKGRFLHPEENRAITMREAALLQGFPRRYKFATNNNKCAVASMIGNALPPPFIAMHARMILNALQPDVTA